MSILINTLLVICGTLRLLSQARPLGLLTGGYVARYRSSIGEKYLLLCTFYFQKDADKDKKTAQYCSMFFELSQPLQDAWVWRTIRTHLPEDR